MTTLREAAQQALEALEYDTKPEPKYGINAAITALRAALAEPIKAGMNRDDIIRMAQEAGIPTSEVVIKGNGTHLRAVDVERFAALVTAEKDKQIARLRDENVYLVNFPRCSRCDSGEG